MALWGFAESYRQPPDWAPEELKVGTDGKLRHALWSPRYRTFYRSSQARDYDSIRLVEVSLEVQAFLYELAVGVRSAAEKKAEKQRRKEKRTAYKALAAAAHGQAKAALQSAIENGTEDEAADAARVRYRTHHELARATEEAMQRWPGDLKKTCPGDMGPLGELVLIGAELMEEAS